MAEDEWEEGVMEVGAGIQSHSEVEEEGAVMEEGEERAVVVELVVG